MNESDLERLKRIFLNAYQRRTLALKTGECSDVDMIDWAIPEYRVRFSEICDLADDLGMEWNVVDLRMACENWFKEVGVRCSGLMSEEV